MARPLHPYATELVLATDATALALPPVDLALVDDEFNKPDGAVPEFDLELWADGARALSAATLYGAHAHAFAHADTTVTANATTNALAAVAHGFLTGDGPLRITGADVPLPLVATVASALDLAFAGCANIDTVVQAEDPGLGALGDAISLEIVMDAGAQAGSLVEDVDAQTATFHLKPAVSTVADFEALVATSALLSVKTAGTGATVLAAGDALAPANLRNGVTGGDYWAVEGADADHLKLAGTRDGALSGDAIDLTDAGSGTIKLVDVTDETERVHWHSHGLLGLNDDGVVELDEQKSYMVRCRHTPRAFAYAVTATFGAGSGTVSAAVYSVWER